MCPEPLLKETTAQGYHSQKLDKHKQCTYFWKKPPKGKIKKTDKGGKPNSLALTFLRCIFLLYRRQIFIIHVKLLNAYLSQGGICACFPSILQQKKEIRRSSVHFLILYLCFVKLIEHPQNKVQKAFLLVIRRGLILTAA